MIAELFRPGAEHKRAEGDTRRSPGSQYHQREPQVGPYVALEYKVAYLDGPGRRGTDTAQREE